jgi:tRNA A-37 threonylcarbamoyl transferase component Bud32
VPRALAWERFRPQEAFFVGDFIKGAGPWPAEVPEALLVKLARAVRQLHEARYLHRDLHVGNVLVAGVELYLIDFHGGYFVPWLPRMWEARMLGMLVASLWAREQDHLAVPFLREYAGRIDRRLEARVFRHAALHRARHLRSRSKRCVIDSTSFAVERRGRTATYRRRELHADQLEALRAAPGRAVSENRHGAVYLLAAAGRRWCRKTVRYSRLHGYVARLFSGRLYQAWRGGNALAVHGVGVAKPYAYVRRMALGAIREEVLIAEELVGFQSLTGFLQSASPEQLAALCPSLAVSLARFMTRFHATRFWQHDLAPKNIMVRRAEEDAW